MAPPRVSRLRGGGCSGSKPPTGSLSAGTASIINAANKEEGRAQSGYEGVHLHDLLADDVDIVVAATFVSDDGDAPKAEASMPVVVASMTPDDTAPNDQSVPSAARTEEIRRARTEETDEESNSTAPSLLPAYTEVWDVAHLDPSHVPFLEMLDRHAAKGQRLTMAFVFSPFKLVKVLELMTETLDHGKGPCRSRYFATFTECAEVMSADPQMKAAANRAEAAAMAAQQRELAEMNTSYGMVVDWAASGCEYAVAYPGYSAPECDCPGKHGLVHHVAATSTSGRRGFCDLCGTRYWDTDDRYTCQQCDYNVCMDCVALQRMGYSIPTGKGCRVSYRGRVVED